MPAACGHTVFSNVVVTVAAWRRPEYKHAPRATTHRTLKHDTKAACFKKFKAEVLPVLKKTLGFFDVVVLENETEPTKIFCISFWETKKHAEYYEKEWYPKVKAMIETFFLNPPVVKYYTPEETFSENLFTTTV